MPEASLRNTLKQKIHKERHQPAARARLGFLEKHKDYVARARDYHSKQDRLNRLREKATFRNPDEFYHAMIHSRVADGVHRQNSKQSINADTLKVLKTQDYCYINHKLTAEKSKIERMQNSLHFIGTKLNTHTIFVDNLQEGENFDAATHFNTPKELAGRSFNRPRVDTLKSNTVMGIPVDLDGTADVASRTVEKQVTKALDKTERGRARPYVELAERMQREEKLDHIRHDLENQRNQFSKGRKQKLQEKQDGKPAVFRWRKERKR
eukprot:TRINITY_DN15811_c0_g1::TRINITY_DN15811_c0_g1_i1::g.25501::m.25501 TRINITY_DN15811_c0_g1::TRINITY_DN15811_c0_g1_i1::g.25501  ORF type:complete len:266 (+),score=43.57,sp/Q9CZJ1/UTP11_MOUSE/38.43/1e-51,Utp11/PF03998.8/1.1e-67,DUF3763/PF12592.3/2.8e+03,DUF3763/PF12592.3/4.8e+03,DUF3763/PF12592.3/0.21 TRINITY_DN15811_c0_g1_i1:26-823(+)